jgi:hypothetical protein
MVSAKQDFQSDTPSQPLLGRKSRDTSDLIDYAETATSACGTNRTGPAGLAMSVVRGRPEVGAGKFR